MKNYFLITFYREAALEENSELLGRMRVPAKDIGDAINKGQRRAKSKAYRQLGCNNFTIYQFIRSCNI